MQKKLYDISISIGNSFELESMLTSAVETMMSRLEAQEVVIYHQTNSSFSVCFGLPKTPDETSVSRQILIQKACESFQTGESFWMNTIEDGCEYFFNLPNLGVLYLRKIGLPIADMILQQMPRLHEKLVTSIKACLNYEALEKKHQQLLESQQMAYIGSWELNLQSDALWWSDETYRIFEKDRENLVVAFKDFIELIHPEDREMVQSAYQESLETQSSYQVEHRLLFADGHIKYVVEHGRSEYDEKGNAVRSIGTVQDITEKKLIEKSLRAREKELNDIVESIPLMLFVKDAKDLSFVRLNRAGEELLNIDREALIGRTDYDLFPKEQADFFVERDRQTLEMGGALLVENELLNTPSGVKTLHTTKVPIKDEQGNPKYLLGVSEDITELKHKEEALSKASTVIMNLSEGIMITDANNQFESINPAFSAITGYDMEDVDGKKPCILSSGQHGQDFYQSMWASIHQFGNWQGEIWNRRKNGEVYPEWLSISVIRDAQGEIVNYVGVFTDISSIKESEAELRFLAHHDSLTKLPNRVLLNDRIEHALRQAKRNDKQLAILYIDLDHFKSINDSFGHPSGDEFLLAVSGRLESVLRHGDTISRVSGDEFVVLLEGIHNIEEVSFIAQKVLDAIADPVRLGAHEVTITASIGISMAPMDASKPVHLLKNADTALFRAKEMGRNHFEFFSKDMSSSSFETLFMLNGLHKALVNEEFAVYYQPQVDMRTHQLMGVEALIRWIHPEMGLVPPGRFIPLAEESGLMVRVGEWVLRESCLQMKRWQSEGVSVDYIAVNISGRQLMDRSFVSVVKSALEEAQLDGKFIELEVTETLVMREESYYSKVIEKLKALGIRISIDDFGTGYSSLVRLKNLSIDKLKIDMSFIRDIPQDEENGNITRTIIQLAKGMNLKVIAEGVENEEQKHFLLENGCHLAQGYFYSRPLPAGDFVEWSQMFRIQVD